MMKKLLTAFLCVGIFVPLKSGMAVNIGGPVTPNLCRSVEQCMAGCISGFCCMTGEQKTVNNCPSGWSYSSSAGVCTRSPTDGVDGFGYYTQNYGTCSATVTQVDCYAYSATDISDGFHITCLACGGV